MEAARMEVAMVVVSEVMEVADVMGLGVEGAMVVVAKGVGVRVKAAAMVAEVVGGWVNVGAVVEVAMVVVTKEV